MSTDDENAQNSVSAEPVRASRTYVEDWTWMLGILGLPARTLQYYIALRAFVYEKDSRATVELDDDEIAHFMGCSRDSVNRARKDAQAWGLVTVQGEKSRVGYTRGIKHQLPVSRSVRMRLDPPEDVPTNCYAELQRFRAAQEEARTAGQDGSADLRDRPDQGKDVSAGQDGSADLRDRDADLRDRDADLRDRDADLREDSSSHQEEPASQVSFQVSRQQLINKTRASARAGDDVAPSGRNDGATAPSTDAGEPPASPEPASGGVRERSRVLLSSLSMPHGPAFTVHASAVDAVAAKLEEHSESTITAALMEGIEAYKIPAAGVSTRLRDLARLLADRQTQTAPQPASGSVASIPPVCGHCEGREGDPVNGRLVLDGVHDIRGRWCPRCHPKGIEKNSGGDEGQDVAGLAADAAAAIGLPA